MTFDKLIPFNKEVLTLAYFVIVLLVLLIAVNQIWGINPFEGADPTRDYNRSLEGLAGPRLLEGR